MKFLELNFNPVVVDGKHVNNTASFYEALNVIGVSPPGQSECVYAESESELIDFTKEVARDEMKRANLYKPLSFSSVDECGADEIEKAVWKEL